MLPSDTDFIYLRSKYVGACELELNVSVYNISVGLKQTNPDQRGDYGAKSHGRERDLLQVRVQIPFLIKIPVLNFHLKTS